MATTAKSRPGLELNDDPAFQEGFWRAERVAWFVFAAVVLAAALGLTGRGGPFARATAASPTGSIDYPRITRGQAPDQLLVRVPSGGDQVAIELDRSFTETFALTGALPRPESSMATGDGHRLVFDLAASPAERTIMLEVEARHPSIPLNTRVRIGDGPPLRLTSVILP